jgi:hypothetical protein
MIYPEFHYHAKAHKFLYRFFYCHKLYPLILCVCARARTCFFLKFGVKTNMTVWGVLGWPAPVRFYAISDWVTWYSSELTSVAKRSKSFELLVFLG